MGRARIVRDETARVHGLQLARPPMPDHHGFHGLDTIHAHDLGIRHHGQMSGGRTGSFPQASPEVPSRLRVTSTQHHQHASAVVQRLDNERACGVGIARDDQVNGSVHRVEPAGACPAMTTGPLSVRRNASSWRSSSGLSRSGRSSL